MSSQNPIEALQPTQRRRRRGSIHFADHNAPKSVWEITGPDKPPYVAKLATRPLSEIFSGLLLSKFNFQQLIYGVHKPGSDSAEQIIERIHSPVPQGRVVLEMALVTGRAINNFRQTGTESAAQQLGALAVLDAVLNNTDRLPTITEHEGNWTNILETGTRIVPIDNQITLPDPEAKQGYLDRLTRLAEDVLSDGELCGPTPMPTVKRLQGRVARLGRLSHPMERLVTALLPHFSLQEDELERSVRVGARRTLFGFIAWKEIDFDKFHREIVKKTGAATFPGENLDDYITHLRDVHGQLVAVRNSLQRHSYLRRVSAREVFSTVDMA
ncbi:Actin-fragmin kinase, catalytic [Carpediemonas membranifera]|uniref:Actin-fragmin kinase, catalytic n=1 Tax=Carpediemonas membranifera TaxID=201153 RepID=A0A8J6E761_9EUKA|nr:Actin-fragmin kinase, catalytic [Carpediemonas membranifera]|eukprot:KAG9390340.1 Actin-fragmin kinase, catalytic [Carpediemonas membranifera]